MSAVILAQTESGDFSRYMITTNINIHYTGARVTSLPLVCLSKLQNLLQGSIIRTICGRVFDTLTLSAGFGLALFTCSNTGDDILRSNEFRTCLIATIGSVRSFHLHFLLQKLAYKILVQPKSDRYECNMLSATSGRKERLVVHGKTKQLVNTATAL